MVNFGASNLWVRGGRAPRPPLDPHLMGRVKLFTAVLHNCHYKSSRVVQTDNLVEKLPRPIRPSILT